MSHNKERAEKTCLNCGTNPLHDRYCHHCGQENVEPKQTLWHLITHFFKDITHFDGKFFHTLKYLLVKPGFLSAEYIRGARTKYLDPVRLYLFISAAFFILFYSVVPDIDHVSLKDKEKIRYIDSLRNAEADHGFSFTITQDDHGNEVSYLTLNPQLQKGHAYYDSLQRTLPEPKRAGLLQRYWQHHLIDIYSVYEDDPYNFVPKAVNKCLHSLSKMFFISVPLFALLLYLLSIRKRKQFYYVSHAIFTLHYYSVGFIIFALLTGVSVLPFVGEDVIVWSIVGVLGLLLIYLYVAMLRFYKRHWFRTLIKFLVLIFLNSILLSFLVFALFMHSMATAGH